MRPSYVLYAVLAALQGACGGGSSSSSGEPGDAGTDGSHLILDGGGEPATPPDGASLCPSGACNYQTNEGCPTGQTCWPYLSGSTTVTPTCVPAGTKTSGAPCTDQTECALGYACVGTCQKLCCGGDWTGCASGEHCFIALKYGDGQGGVVDTGAMLCYPVGTCDALVPSSCTQPGETCQIVDATGATACRVEGTVDVGGACSATAFCKGGATCVQGASGWVCRPLCKAVESGGEPSCASTEYCIHYVRDPDGVGECTPG